MPVCVFPQPPQNAVPHLIGPPKVIYVLFGVLGLVPWAHGVHVPEVDVIEVVEQMPVANKKGTAPLAQHVAGHLGKPHSLVLAFFQGRVKIGHPSGIGQHGGVFLIRPKALHQLAGQLVGQGEAIGIGSLSAVELEAAAVCGQFHQLEAERGRAFAPADGKVLHRPLAPFALLGNGHATGAVPIATHQHSVVPPLCRGDCQQVERRDIAAQPSDYLNAALQRRGLARG